MVWKQTLSQVTTLESCYFYYARVYLRNGSYANVFRLFCLVWWNNFGKEHFEKQFSEIILNLKPVVQEVMSFKYNNLIFSNILVTLLFGRTEVFVQLW